MNFNLFNKKIKLTSNQILLITLLSVILIGTLLLKLPISNKDGKSIRVIDSFFVSTSAVCVTGLSTVVPAEQFTTFGQIILMCLIEIGGLGFMTFLALILMKLGKKINLSNRLIIKEALNQENIKGNMILIRHIFAYTIIIELIGAAFLSISFIPQYGISKGIFYAIFHSISALCNSGFDIIGDSSLMSFQNDIIVNVTIMLLIVIGGLGFTVWSELLEFFKGLFKGIQLKKLIKKLSLHTKLVVITTFILLTSGTLFLLGLEYNNSSTIKNDTFGNKVLKSAFMSTSLRTAGFSTINPKDYTTASKFISICYMFIGGSPASAAGGIKTVTFAVMILVLINYLYNKDEICIWGKNIPHNTIKRVIVVFTISIFIIIVAIMSLLISESIFKEDILTPELAETYNFSFIEIFYEAVSAFGTVGLTLGITSKLTFAGKIIISILMIIGRLRSNNNIYGSI